MRPDSGASNTYLPDPRPKPFVPRLLKRIPSLALLLAWFAANGALLDVVQVLAWGRMFADYAQTLDTRAALERTFDPAKPCQLCRQVSRARDDAKSALPAGAERSSEKLVLALQKPNPVLFFRETETWNLPPSAKGPRRSDPVPVPPPKRLS
jgi:hypothetical protein